MSLDVRWCLGTNLDSGIQGDEDGDMNHINVNVKRATFLHVQS